MIGERIRELRQLRGHTQQSLGEVLGVSPRQVWRWESAESVPTADYLVQLARTLDTSSDYLLGITEDPRPVADKDGLTAAEWQILNALRSGDRMAAIRAIANE